VGYLNGSVSPRGVPCPAGEADPVPQGVAGSGPEGELGVEIALEVEVLGQRWDRELDFGGGVDEGH
jgi:hypothetical protein